MILSMEYNTITLPNGIRLIHLAVDSPVAHCGVVINTGSRDENPAEQGMAHFIEHTIFKGTVKRKAYHIISRLEDVGGEMNAYTSKEETAIHASFLCEYYERAIELFSDILIDSTFPEKELKKEQELIVDEFEELIYEGHPMGRNILGTPELVRSFQSADIRRFMDVNYHTDQMVICSVGNIPAKKFFHMAQRYFERLTSNLRQSERIRFTSYQPKQKKVEKGTFQ